MAPDPDSAPHGVLAPPDASSPVVASEAQAGHGRRRVVESDGVFCEFFSVHGCPCRGAGGRGAFLSRLDAPDDSTLGLVSQWIRQSISASDASSGLSRSPPKPRQPRHAPSHTPAASDSALRTIRQSHLLQTTDGYKQKGKPQSQTHRPRASLPNRSHC
jgi:hypothetical protein